MIDLKELRQDPDRFRLGTKNKGHDPKVVDALLDADEQLRAAKTQREQLTAEKNKISKEIGKLAGQLGKASGDEQVRLQAQMKQLQQHPNEIKQRESDLDDQLPGLQNKRDNLWLKIPQPPDSEVPVGGGAEDNIEISRWQPDWFDPDRTFKENKGFVPKSHIELMRGHGMVDFERGVKMAGTRSYVLMRHGMRLHNAILRYAFDFMVNENGFTPTSVPVLVRDHVMFGTGFFPHDKDAAYHIANPTTDDEFSLTGTGEVGLMGVHGDEIVGGEELPLTYTTVSTCFRREAGAAGKDTAGLFRIHQFDKVEQVVICKADEAESRAWHKKMIGFVETLMQRLELPYRLLQCCTGDLGQKNADMIDIEAWMPSRGVAGDDGIARGDWGETHSASRLYEYQCRRLNLRYRDPDTKKPTICHALNNTVAASPRILIPIVEMYQNQDGSITVPEVLRPHMGGLERIEQA